MHAAPSAGLRPGVTGPGVTGPGVTGTSGRGVPTGSRLPRPWRVPSCCAMPGCRPVTPQRSQGFRPPSCVVSCGACPWTGSRRSTAPLPRRSWGCPSPVCPDGAAIWAGPVRHKRQVPEGTCGGGRSRLPGEPAGHEHPHHRRDPRPRPRIALASTGPSRTAVGKTASAPAEYGIAAHRSRRARAAAGRCPAPPARRLNRAPAARPVPGDRPTSPRRQWRRVCQRSRQPPKPCRAGHRRPAGATFTGMTAHPAAVAVTCPECVRLRQSAHQPARAGEPDPRRGAPGPAMTRLARHVATRHLDLLPGWVAGCARCDELSEAMRQAAAAGLLGAGIAQVGAEHRALHMLGAPDTAAARLTVPGTPGPGNSQ